MLWSLSVRQSSIDASARGTRVAMLGCQTPARPSYRTLNVVSVSLVQRVPNHLHSPCMALTPPCTLSFTSQSQPAAPIRKRSHLLKSGSRAQSARLHLDFAFATEPSDPATPLRQHSCSRDENKSPLLMLSPQSVLFVAGARHQLPRLGVSPGSSRSLLWDEIDEAEEGLSASRPL